ncbi:unannotated protein [freshwater metagenome]|uniref:Unannotated protein n=1 Tax=freshwater metagenome TaxID=449393 RepID=A0A6J6EDM6_9ZZZZ
MLILSILLLSMLKFSPSANAATSGSGICQQTYTLTSGNESVVVTSSGNYCYVVFKNLASAGAAASMYSWTKPSGITSLDVLVIGGGGGGGARHGGGGGGGSFVQATSYPIASGATNINVAVGSGGVAANGSSSYVGSRGGESSFKIGVNGLTAIGGGAGVNGSTSEINGGSGGGSGWSQTSGIATRSTQKTLDGISTLTGIEFGENGDSGVADANSGASFNKDYWAAGGGGGAGGDGKRPSLNGSEYTASNTFPDGDGSNTRGGDGGIGKVSTLISADVATALGMGQVSSGSAYFAGGGGGGIGADGAAGGNGGIGGGGNGTRAIASGGVAGLVSTGGGGGGSGFDDISPVAGDVTNPPGGAGGSGIVVIRYIPPLPAVTASATVSGITTFNQILTSTTGTWNNIPSAYSYQWLRAATSDGTYSAISGATSSTYKLTSSDVGQFIRVAVTASNVGGSTTDTSVATAAIAAATSSTSVSLAAGDLFFRTAKLITATPTVAGRLTFRANNVIIPGCKNLNASANVARNCSYKPNRRGYVTISVTLVPTDAGFSSNLIRTSTFFVFQRSEPR